MIHEDTTAMVTVVGGERYDGNQVSVTNAAFQLLLYGSGNIWKEMEALPYPIGDHMLVNYEQYLYVIGGVGCAGSCVRMSFKGRGSWEKMGNLGTSTTGSKRVQKWYILRGISVRRENTSLHNNADAYAS